MALLARLPAGRGSRDLAAGRPRERRRDDPVIPKPSRSRSACDCECEPTDAIEGNNHMQRAVPALELLAVCRAGQERDELGPRDLDERERP